MNTSQESVMASAIALAATAFALVCSLTMAAPAAAADQVYVWRDPSGVIQFSTVEKPVRDADVAAASMTSKPEPEAQLVVVTDANK